MNNLQSKERSHSILDNLLEGCQIIGFDWRYLYLNKAAEGHNQRSNIELLGNKYTDMWPGIEKTQVFRIMKHCMEERVSQQMENEFVFPDETVGWFDLSIQPVPEGILILSIDITERKGSELTIRESEEKYRSLFNNNYAVMLIIDPETGAIVDANPAACQYYGWTTREFREKSITAINTLSKNAVFKKMETVKTEGYGHLFFQHRLANGEIREVEVHSGPIKISGKSLLYFIVHDITERKLAEEVIHRSEEQFRTLFMSMSQGFYLSEIIYDNKGNPCDYKYLEVNPKFEQIIGLSRDQILGKRYKELVPVDTTQWLENYCKVARTGESLNYEFYSNEYQMYFETFSYQPVKGQVSVFVLDITERKKAEELLRENERRLSTLMGNLPGIAYRCANDKDWTMEYVSGGCFELTGYVPDELVNNSVISFNELIHEEYQEYLFNKWQDVLRLKETFQDEYRIITKDGKEKWVWEQGCGVYSDDDKVIALEGFIADITERKLAEQRIERYSRIFEDSLNEIYLFAADTLIFTQVNRAAQQNLGYTMEELQKLTPLDLKPELTSESFAKLTAPLRKGKQGKIVFETVHKRKDQSLYNVEVHLQLLKYEHESLFAAIILDITGRKRMEENLEAAKNHLDSLVKASPTIIYTCEVSDEYAATFISENILFVFGYTQQEFLSYPTFWTDHIHPEDKERIFSDLVNILDKGLHIHEYRFRIKDDSYHWVRDELKVTYDNNLNPIEMSGYITDITERKRAEELIIHERSMLRTLIDNLPDLIYVKDIDYRKVIANKADIKNIGFKKEEDVLGKTDLELFPGPIGERGYADDKVVISSGKAIIEREEDFVNKKGERLWLRTSKLPLHDKDGKITGLVGIGHDITHRKENEEELVRAKEKAEESDRLKTAFLHNISHEIRTPMNAITGFASLLNNPGLPPNKITDYTTIISNSSHQLLSIITDIIHIATIEAGQEKVVEKEMNLNYLLNTLYLQFEAVAKPKGIRLIIETPLDDSESDLITDETKLSEILTNLINNALKFTKKGTVTISYTVINTFLEFSVKDTGIGIPAGMHEKIFDRFLQVDHTVTREHEGTGLGLSISKAYVNLLGGEIWVASQPDKGSDFCFTIPFNRKSSISISESHVESEQELQLNDAKTILIAEDEDMNYFLVEEYLVNPDITLLRARNGIEAVELFKSDATIDLVLMDIKMPRMDGYEATRKIRVINPDIPIVAIMAYAQAEDKGKAINAGCSAYIPKPVIKKTLLAVIGKFLLSK